MHIPCLRLQPRERGRARTAIKPASLVALYQVLQPKLHTSHLLLTMRHKYKFCSGHAAPRTDLNLLPIFSLATALIDGIRTKKETQDYPRTMLNKLSKQQHLLLQELERTKRRLRAEISARERRTDGPSNDAPTTSPGHAGSWVNQRSDGADVGGRPSSSIFRSPSSQRSNKRASQPADGGRGPNAPGARFKRSRNNEACKSPTDSDAAGAEKQRAPKAEDSCRPSPATRIGMLPVMSSTGAYAT